MVSKVYVGNLSWDTTDDVLAHTFSQYGQLTDYIVMKDRETGRSRGFGFVTYATQEEADAAIRNLNEFQLDGRTIRVNMANSRPRNDGFRAGFAGGFTGYGGYGAPFGAPSAPGSFGVPAPAAGGFGAPGLPSAYPGAQAFGDPSAAAAAAAAGYPAGPAPGAFGNPQAFAPSTQAYGSPQAAFASQVAFGAPAQAGFGAQGSLPGSAPAAGFGASQGGFGASQGGYGGQYGYV